MITYPPSPAISICDSLADIDDLDAFLEAQGQLSHWPTPPQAKQEWIVQETEIGLEDEDEDEVDAVDCKVLANPITSTAI